MTPNSVPFLALSVYLSVLVLCNVAELSLQSNVTSCARSAVMQVIQQNFVNKKKILFTACCIFAVITIILAFFVVTSND